MRPAARHAKWNAGGGTPRIEANRNRLEDTLVKLTRIGTVLHRALAPARLRTGLRQTSTIVALAIAACLPTAAHAQHFVATADTSHPRIRYADSLLSVNDRCMVTQRKLSTRMPAIYVNGVPMGFC